MKKNICYITTVIFLLDLISKYIIFNLEDIEIIKGFFNITKSKNTGIAFSMLNNSLIFIIIANIAILFLLVKYIKYFKNNKRNIIAFSLIIGGLLGNLHDRLIFGFVRDFLDFKILSYNYPIFNIADTSICLGVLLLVIAIMKGEDMYGKNNK